MLERGQFLQLLALAGTMGGCSSGSPGPEDAAEPPDTAALDTSDEFWLRAVDDVAAALRGGLAYIGDKLGIFRAMAGAGALSADELASRTGLNARYVREWLAAMATARYVDYHHREDTFSLPDGRAAVLADESSPHFLGGMIQAYVVPPVSAAPKVAEAFRTGRPVTPDQYDPDLWAGMERDSAALYRHNLVQQWLPALSGVVEKLERGAHVLDYSCGNGRAAVIMARAFPNARFTGRDIFGPSIQAGRDNARQAELEDRITFEQGSFEGLPEAEFDLITILYALHHYPDPAATLAGLRRALKPDGTLLIVNDRVSENLMENAHPWGRFVYGVSALYCLHDSMAESAIGAAMMEPQVREVSRTAGFSRFRRVPVDSPYVALDEVRV
jgi:SAM-dependent methyltransferase